MKQRKNWVFSCESSGLKRMGEAFIFNVRFKLMMVAKGLLYAR